MPVCDQHSKFSVGEREDVLVVMSTTIYGGWVVVSTLDFVVERNSRSLHFGRDDTSVWGLRLGTGVFEWEEGALQIPRLRSG